MRIAIVTFHRAYNCGAVLQAWALKTVLERMGHMVEFPVCNHVGETKRWLYDWVNKEKHGFKIISSLFGRSLINGMSIPSEDVLRWRYRRFRRANFAERCCLPGDFGGYYDLVIVGSDQVWNEKLSADESPVFFAENIPADVRKIAYAASCGDQPLDDAAVKRTISAIERFSVVSVREPMAKRQLERYTRKQIDTTLDPTLLLNSVDYDAIATQPSFGRKPYLFMYTLFINAFFLNTAKVLADSLGVRCVIAPCYQYTRYGAPSGLTYGVSPDRLVGLVRDAKYVLAGSFHGTVMGVLFNKPFLSLRNKVDEYESRQAALLSVLGCGNRLVCPETSIDEMMALLEVDIPSRVHEILNTKRLESLEWLKVAVG